MQLRRSGNGWQKAIWKVVTNPAVEVVAAILAVLFAAWIVIATDVDNPRHNPFPIPVRLR